MTNSCLTRWLALLAAVFLATASSAYAADAKLKADPFFESIQPDVDVSGFVVVGLSTGTLISGHDIPQLHLKPDNSMAGMDVCLTVQSRDGIYLSRNTYVLPAVADGGPVGLSYEASTSLDLLENYGDRQLAVSVLTGSCQDPHGLYLRPHGGRQAGRGNSLNLMINGFGATDVFYSIPSLNLDADCDPLRDGRTTVFDFWCQIELPQPQSDRLTIRVERERYGRALPPATLTIAADAQ